MHISGIGMQINSVVCTADIGMLTMQVWWYANKQKEGGGGGRSVYLVSVCLVCLLMGRLVYRDNSIFAIIG